MLDAWLGLVHDLERSFVLEFWWQKAILEVNRNHDSFIPETLVLCMVKHASSNRNNRLYGALSCPIGLMSVGDRNLLLDTLVFVEKLARISCKLASPVMPHKLDLLSELRLDLQNVSLDEFLAV